MLIVVIESKRKLHHINYLLNFIKKHYAQQQKNLLLETSRKRSIRDTDSKKRSNPRL
jgi:hypothetical protein